MPAAQPSKSRSIRRSGFDEQSNSYIIKNVNLNNKGVLLNRQLKVEPKRLSPLAVTCSSSSDLKTANYAVKQTGISIKNV